jgi:hypothetical protein
MKAVFLVARLLLQASAIVAVAWLYLAPIELDVRGSGSAVGCTSLQSTPGTKLHRTSDRVDVVNDYALEMIYSYHSGQYGYAYTERDYEKAERLRQVAYSEIDRGCIFARQNRMAALAIALVLMVLTLVWHPEREWSRIRAQLSRPRKRSELGRTDNGPLSTLARQARLESRRSDGHDR